MPKASLPFPQDAIQAISCLQRVPRFVAPSMRHTAEFPYEPYCKPYRHTVLRYAWAAESQSWVTHNSTAPTHPASPPAQPPPYLTEKTSELLIARLKCH